MAKKGGKYKDASTGMPKEKFVELMYQNFENSIKEDDTEIDKLIKEYDGPIELCDTKHSLHSRACQMLQNVKSDHRYTYDIDEEWIMEKLKKGKCEATGLPFDYTIGTFVKDSKTTNPFTPSIDRIDSNEGYMKDNCWIVLWAVNRGKGDNSIESYLKICESIAKNKDMILERCGGS